MNNLDAIAGIAKATQEDLSATNQQVRWLGYVMRAITLAVDHGEYGVVAGLSEVGTHLSDEWAVYLEGQIGMFERCLDEEKSK
ncbi:MULTISPECIES: hypothetical protein [Pseudomonas]|uniref:hypothetical protein n=1 Tax=Pseudomonas TaxID=286 RepID=UPI000CD58ABA|nr:MULTISPECIES: hypothetical protein [Pseudomonas]RBH54211.1 hypothetical protein C3F00_024545 [Pseudomonas sp. MWU13-2860]